MKDSYNKLRDNKQLKVLLIAVALVLVTIGSTYAWWTASKTVEQKVSMGNLKIEANFGNETHTNYEPGTYVEIDGTIKNTGSIPAIIKIENDSAITFAYADDVLTVIPEADRQAEAVDGSAVTIDYEPQSGDYTDNDDVIWFTHADGNKYLLMDPAANLRVSIQVNFNGKNTTNRYMDAVIDAKAKLKATQVLEGAISSEFGIDASDLIDLPTTRTISAKGQSRLQELLNRGK